MVALCCVPVGLVVDWRHGRLLFTNEDSVNLDGVTYSWQRIESIGLDGSGRRAIVTSDIQRPRGLAIDFTQQSVYSPRIVTFRPTYLLRLLSAYSVTQYVDLVVKMPQLSSLSLLGLSDTSDLGQFGPKDHAQYTSDRVPRYTWVIGTLRPVSDRNYRLSNKLQVSADTSVRICGSEASWFRIVRFPLMLVVDSL